MKFLLSALLALPLMVASGAALADQDHGHGQGRDHDDHDRRGDWHDGDRDRGDWHDGDRDRGDWHDNGHGHGHYDNGWHGRHHWERGRRYDGPIVIIRDYDSYRLRPPPRGYHWVRDDSGDYVLVAIATGIILDYVLH
ncbi:MAG TPA: RcnB family protein [Frateuria sp.]|uniref:RcnB family protein n=1 Tax=Frateuria sp. TaxID=2211372 RepID=UPI002DE5D0E1|nr:RcnB family protein [Frateuria sp.]